MANTNIFEYATKNKMRFPYKGLISVEDLWDLPMTELDKIFKTLNAELQQCQTESLLLPSVEGDRVLDIQIEIIKHIFNVKLEEQKARERAAAVKEHKQKIMSIIAKKQDESLENASIDELNAMLSDLD